MEPERPPPVLAEAPPPPAPTPPAVAPAASGVTTSAPAAGPAVNNLRSPVPKPTLPRVYQARDADQVARVLAAVEAALPRAGISPEYARGITGAFRRVIGGSAEIYPVAMYYYIVREAYLKHDKSAAAGNLAAAQSNGVILKFKNLPAIEQRL
jgi:hypothetical protein